MASKTKTTDLVLSLLASHHAIANFFATRGVVFAPMVVAERHSAFATVMAVPAHFIDDPNTLKAFFACATGKPLVAFCASFSLLHFVVILACGVLALEDATTSTTKHQNTHKVSTNAITNKQRSSSSRKRTERQTWDRLESYIVATKAFSATRSTAGVASCSHFQLCE